MEWFIHNRNILAAIAAVVTIVTGIAALLRFLLRHFSRSTQEVNESPKTKSRTLTLHFLRPYSAQIAGGIAIVLFVALVIWGASVHAKRIHEIRVADWRNTRQRLINVITASKINTLYVGPTEHEPSNYTSKSLWFAGVRVQARAAKRANDDLFVLVQRELSQETNISVRRVESLSSVQAPNTAYIASKVISLEESKTNKSSAYVDLLHVELRRSDNNAVIWADQWSLPSVISISKTCKSGHQ